MAKKFKVDYPKSKETCENCNRLDSCIGVTGDAILSDCRSFYYVFQQLAEKTKMPNFATTDRDGYFEEYLKLPSLFVPQVVNGALAAELAMKGLIYRENRAFDCIHDLEKLFNELPPIHKTALTELIKEQANQTDETFASSLHLFADAFEKARYFFGHSNIAFTGLFNSFVRIVCEYALNLSSDAEKGADIFDV